MRRVLVFLCLLATLAGAEEAPPQWLIDLLDHEARATHPKADSYRIYRKNKDYFATIPLGGRQSNDYSLTLWAYRDKRWRELRQFHHAAPDGHLDNPRVDRLFREVGLNAQDQKQLVSKFWTLPSRERERYPYPEWKQKRLHQLYLAMVREHPDWQYSSLSAHLGGKPWTAAVVVDSSFGTYQIWQWIDEVWVFRGVATEEGWEQLGVSPTLRDERSEQLPHHP